jgi:DNA-binding XRE family transcriptional regulator
MHADKQFLEQTDFSTTIIYSSFVGVIGFDSNLQVRAWNNVMEELSGLPASDVIGEDVLARFPWLSRNGDDVLFTNPLEGISGTKLHRPYAVGETGKKGNVDCSYRPVHNEDGAIQGGVLEVQDMHYLFQRHFSEHGLNPMEARPARAFDCEPFARRLGSLIQQRRKMLNMSQEKFASVCDLHRTYITDIERGARNVAMKNLLAIAQALRLPSWVLLGCAELDAEK